MTAPPPARLGSTRIPAVARVVMFAAVAAAVMFVLFAALGIAGIVTPGDAARPSGRTMVVGYAAELAGMLVATWVMLRWVERRGWDFIALERAAFRPRALGAGLLLGAGAIGVPSLLLFGAGWLQRIGGDATSWPTALALLPVVLAPAALAEELGLRGYPFAVLRGRWGTRTAILVTSVVFGLLHLRNAHAGVEPIGLVILAGVFLAAVLVVTRSLYAAWAAHFAWNFTLAGVVHAAVSGESLPMPGYRLADHGPAWLTGGGWGPEGGAGAAVGTVVAGLVLCWPRLRERRARGMIGPAERSAEFTG